MRRRVYGMGSVQSVPRIMRGYPVARPIAYDVPLLRRKGLDGLESQGLARTLGSLGGCTLGEDIEMAAECMRPGEVMLSPGVCGPDPRRPAVASASRSTSDARKLMVVGGVAVAALYLLSKR